MLYEKIRPLKGSERKMLPHIILFRNYEIGALCLYKSGEPSCLLRPLEISKRRYNQIQLCALSWYDDRVAKRQPQGSAKPVVF